jgi:hypothetical protein
MTTANEFAIRRPRFHLPTMVGTIKRRILINFRCEPDNLAKLLPSPFRPKLINGWGIAGICLIRLNGIRPEFLPAPGGLSSENAAHRIAVEWDENGVTREGVFVPRRDTDAWLNQFAGGKIFPGIHHAANFETEGSDGCLGLKVQSNDGTTCVRVFARLTDQLPDDSVFRSLAEASEFFRRGSLGWSSRPTDGEFDGLELRCREWRMEPLALEEVRSSFFENGKSFPPGSAQFDSAFLMRNIPHEWHARGRLTTFAKADT